MNLAILVLVLFKGTGALKESLIDNIYKKASKVHALADRAIHIFPDHHRHVPLTFMCLFRCNEDHTCRAFHVYTNDSCELVLSPVRGYTRNKESSLYAKGDPKLCLAGFGYMFDAGSLTGEERQLPSCYKFILNVNTWSGSKDICRKLGGDLISIESKEEQLHIQHIVENNSHLSLEEKRHISAKDLGYWTSGSDAESEGTWVWTATGNPVTYAHWYYNSPDNRNQQHYLWIGYMADLQWDDSWGHAFHYPLCEAIGLI